MTRSAEAGVAVTSSRQGSSNPEHFQAAENDFDELLLIDPPPGRPSAPKDRLSVRTLGTGNRALVRFRAVHVRFSHTRRCHCQHSRDSDAGKQLRWGWRWPDWIEPYARRNRVRR